MTPREQLIDRIKEIIEIAEACGELAVVGVLAALVADLLMNRETELYLFIYPYVKARGAEFSGGTCQPR